MSLAQSVTIEKVAGDTIILVFSVTDADGVVVNITGYTLRWTARNMAGGVALSTAASPPTAIAAITDGPGGVYTVTVAAANTASLSGPYRWQSEIVDGGGVVQTVARGWLTFTASVTP